MARSSGKAAPAIVSRRSRSMRKIKFMGYRRENGRVGIRNHVIILPLDDLSNAACEAVANNIKGTLALPHAYGRLQFGEDLALHFRTLIGTGCNANVAAVVVIGIEPGWTGRVVEGIAKTGKPVQGFAIEGNGDLKTIESYTFLRSIVAGQQGEPGFAEAAAVARVQQAMLRSWESGRWETVQF